MLTDRQHHREGRTLANLRGDIDGTVVLVHDVLHDVQADARAWLMVGAHPHLILHLEEGFKDTLEVFFQDADTVVAHGDTEVFSVGLYYTGELHLVLRVFIGVGQQVADHLRHAFLVDDGGKTLVGIFYRELLAALFEGGGKPFTDALHQRVDVLRGKVHHEHLLFHLTEVEQLVHEFQ